MPCSGKHVNDARTSAGSAGLGAVAAVRAAVSHRSRSAESWRLAGVRECCGPSHELTEDHRPAASASPAIAAMQLCQWSTAGPAAHYEPRSSAITTSRISAEQRSKSA